MEADSRSRHLPGEAKVADLDGPGFVEEDVLGLEITMDDSVVVEVHQRRDDLYGVFPDGILFELGGFVQGAGEVLWRVLHYQDHQVVCLDVILEQNDVGVVKLFEDLDLLAEAVELTFVLVSG